MTKSLHRSPLLYLVALGALALVAVLYWATRSPAAEDTDALAAGRAPAVVPGERAVEPDRPAPRALEEPAAGAPARVEAQAPVAGREEPEPLASRPASELRWIVGRVILPAGAVWQEGDRVLSVVPPAREDRSSGLASMILRSEGATAETEERAVLASGAIEPDGSFSVACPRGAEWGYVDLDARFLYLEEPLAVRLEGERTEEELTPFLGACVRGRAIPPDDAQGIEAVVGGGTAFLARDADDEETFARAMFFGGEVGAPGFRHTSIGADGGFELRGIDPSASCWVVVHPPHLAATLSDELELEPGVVTEVEVRLGRGASVAGRVVDDDGDPVGRALVELTITDEEEEYSRTRLLNREALTRADGSFHIGGVRPGEIRLRAEKAGYRDSIRKRLELEAGQEEEGLELRLKRGKALVGSVRWHDGHPAANARIQVGRDATDRQDEVTPAWRRLYGEYACDESGEFLITGLKRRRQSVWAWATRSDGRGGWIEGRAQVDGIKPGEAELELALEPSPLMTGVVRDAAGQPVTAFQVVVRPDTGQGSMVSSMFSQNQQVERDWESPDGTFRLERLGPGDWSATVHAEGFPISEPAGFRLPDEAGRRVLEVVLQGFAGVRGVVVSARGAPLSGAEVTAMPAGWDRGDVLLGDLPSPVRATTNARGEFVMPQLQPGELELRADSDGHVSSGKLELALSPGEQRADVQLQMRLGAVLTGRVLTSAGEPLGEAEVDLRIRSEVGGPFGGASDRHETTTDLEGRFRFDALRPGAATVSVQPSREALQATEQEGGSVLALYRDRLSRTVELVDGEVLDVLLGGRPEGVGEPIAVTGRVTSRGEGVEANVVFSMQDDDRGLAVRQSVRSGEDGRYSLEVPSPGDYRVWVDASGGDDHTYYVLVAAAERVEHDFALPHGRIAGRVFDGEGEPREGVPMTLRVSGLTNTGARDVEFENMLEGQATDAEGRYAFEGLAPGRYVVGAGSTLMNVFVGSAAGYGRLLSEPYDVGLDSDIAGVDFYLEDPCELEGSVVDARGEPVNGASIFVYDGNGQPLDAFSSTSSNSSGRFRYEGLAEGHYTVAARTQDLSSQASESVRVRASGSDEVVLELERGTLLHLTLTDADGTPVRSNLLVTDAGGRQVSNLSGFSGIMTMGRFEESGPPHRHTVGPLAPGTYRAELRSMDGRRVIEDVAVAGEPERDLELPLPR